MTSGYIIVSTLMILPYVLLAAVLTALVLVLRTMRKPGQEWRVVSKHIADKENKRMKITIEDNDGTVGVYDEMKAFFVVMVKDEGDTWATATIAGGRANAQIVHLMAQSMNENLINKFKMLKEVEE